MTQEEKAAAIKKQLVTINKLLKLPENKYCADCKKISPSWASVNLGVFVCINCSGCHREIGVHITKIRSVNLDVWPKDVLKNFKKINNEIANAYWEKHLKKFDFKSIQNDNYKLINFIRDKYENKKWADRKHKDPMTLIIQGKFKAPKKAKEEENDEEEENKSSENEENSGENEENEEEEKEIKNNKRKKEGKKAKEKEEDEDSEDNENKEESEEGEENKNTQNSSSLPQGNV